MCAEEPCKADGRHAQGIDMSVRAGEWPRFGDILVPCKSSGGAYQTVRSEDKRDDILTSKS